jgi:hypothetical protein
MIVNDLHVVSISVLPVRADPSLIVDPNTVLAVPEDGTAWLDAGQGGITRSLPSSEARESSKDISGLSSHRLPVDFRKPHALSVGKSWFAFLTMFRYGLLE